ncbi:L,D-transpeptidase family protein [Verrucomicrobiaceae bacterium N1E253]|uniref:L,D-transpeptidase family protein n=1 Tax=Oceaniferula marina TaxID=2748318 RepID=A0A851GG72_9BACT|nr:L,D-transpeptidase family protein [Oceaniferula marina]NWK54811.1 L,D-transpeptidase family protein [Oceaniferula marina]
MSSKRRQVSAKRDQCARRLRLRGLRGLPSLRRMRWVQAERGAVAWVLALALCVLAWQGLAQSDLKLASVSPPAKAGARADGTGVDGSRGVTVLEDLATRANQTYAESVGESEFREPALLGFGSAFNKAVRQRDLARLESLLRDGVSLLHWEGSGDDGLLAHCVRERELEMLVVLLQYGADPERMGWEGATPLQMAIAMRDAMMVRALLDAGANPNRQYLRPVTDGLLEITETKTMQWFLKKERRLTPLMMAANNGDLAIIKSLLDHGAEKYIRSGRFRLYPLNFASRRSDVKSMQVMLGRDPAKETKHIVLDLSDQRLRLYDDQQRVIFSSRVSTGRAGYRTPKGEYVITDKHRSHRSTIYGVSMPFFQRLSCGAIGFHSGYVPGYPASHGCIRMPYQSAKKMFSLTPAGTRVVIQD